MKLGVLGTGVAGRTLATKLVELGHEVKMGSRSAGNEAAVEWATTSPIRSTSPPACPRR
jgi:predicted dinucleotide-binding enzyme